MLPQKKQNMWLKCHKSQHSGRILSTIHSRDSTRPQILLVDEDLVKMFACYSSDFVRLMMIALKYLVSEVIVFYHEICFVHGEIL